MTLCFSANTFSGIITIADSRINWDYKNKGGDIGRKYNDEMQKIYRLTNHTTICFAGNVNLAGLILKNIIREEMSENILTAMEDFGALLKNLYKQYIRSEEDNDLKFIVTASIFALHFHIFISGK